MKHIYFTLIAVVLISACKSNAYQAEIDKELIQVFEEFELMGLSVGLIVDGEIAYAKSFGTANLVSQRALTNDSYMRIASISKLYTSLAVMKLWEDGLIDLDQPASSYLGWKLKHPQHPDTPITLRHLMDHTSGIRDGRGYGQFSGEMLFKELDIKELFTEEGSHYSMDMFADYEPGTYFSYTNCTWGIIASIVEKVSGKRFDQYTKEAIFEPLAMGSSFNMMDIPTEETAALYRFTEEEWQAQVDDYSTNNPKERIYDGYDLGQNGLIYGPQGSLRASLNDLLTTAQMLISNGAPLLKSETLAYFKDNQWIYDGDNGNTWESFWHAYTKGMHFIQNREGGDIIFPDRKMFGHPGIAYGLLSDLYVDPATQSGVVFITNGSKKKFEYAENSSFYAVEAAVFDVLYPHLKALEEE